MTDDIASLFAYNRWAEARMLDACRQVPPGRYGDEPAPGWSSVRASVALHRRGRHRLSGSAGSSGSPAGATFIVPESGNSSPPPTLASPAAPPRPSDTFDRLIAGLSPDQIAAPFTYRNIKGQGPAPRPAASGPSSATSSTTPPTIEQARSPPSSSSLGVEPPPSPDFSSTGPSSRARHPDSTLPIVTMRRFIGWCRATTLCVGMVPSKHALRRARVAGIPTRNIDGPRRRERERVAS